MLIFYLKVCVKTGDEPCYLCTAERKRTRNVLEMVSDLVLMLSSLGQTTQLTIVVKIMIPLESVSSIPPQACMTEKWNPEWICGERSKFGSLGLKALDSYRTKSIFSCHSSAIPENNSFSFFHINGCNSLMSKSTALLQ